MKPIYRGLRWREVGALVGLLLSATAQADPQPRPLEPETLVALPKQICSFQFKDVKHWRLVGTPVAGDCRDADLNLRFLDGKTYRWMTVEATDDDPERTISTDPRPRVFGAIRKGSLDDERISVELPNFSAELIRDGDHWSTQSSGGNAGADLIKTRGKWIISAAVSLRGHYDSGHYCCMLGGIFYIIDDRHGHLLFLSGLEDTLITDALIRKLVDLP
jgi:hypothetical protein